MLIWVGVVVDLFIVEKKNKLGQMFSIIRFIMVVNRDTLLKSLWNIQISNLTLHANMARFSHDVVKPKVLPMSVNDRPISKAFMGKVSYAKVLTGDQDNGLTSGEIHSKSYVPFKGGNNLLYPLAPLGCYKDFRVIGNTRTMYQGEGFLDVEPLYLGGLWVLRSRDLFLNHSGINTWFSEIKPRHKDFLC